MRMFSVSSTGGYQEGWSLVSGSALFAKLSAGAEGHLPEAGSQDHCGRRSTCAGYPICPARSLRQLLLAIVWRTERDKSSGSVCRTSGQEVRKILPRASCGSCLAVYDLRSNRACMCALLTTARSAPPTVRGRGFLCGGTVRVQNLRAAAAVAEARAASPADRMSGCRPGWPRVSHQIEIRVPPEVLHSDCSALL